MKAFACSIILASLLPLAGCNDHKTPPPPPPTNRPAVETHAPGVDVKAGNGNVDVKAPGADVEVQRK